MSVQTAVSTMRAMRQLIAGRLASVPEADLHRVPDGFNSNLIWQLGHLAVTPALLTYKRTGLEMPLVADLVATYGKGTKPGSASAAATVEELSGLMFGIIDRIEADEAAGVFGTFEPYQTSAGVPLSSLSEALEFLAVHDGIHVGYTLALARVLS